MCLFLIKKEIKNAKNAIYTEGSSEEEILNYFFILLPNFA
jgi:hypothetical protein